MTRLHWPEMISIYPIDPAQLVDEVRRTPRRRSITLPVVKVKAQVEVFSETRTKDTGGSTSLYNGEIVMRVRDCVAKTYTPAVGDEIRQTTFKNSSVADGTILYLGEPARVERGRLYWIPLSTRAPERRTS